MLTSEKVQHFLENHNLTYLFLLLANKESDRLSALPPIVKKKLKGKITSLALEHIATGEIPDYIVPEETVKERKMDAIIDEMDEENWEILNI